MTDKFSHKLADNYKLAMSGLFIHPTAATYNLVLIPTCALVDDVWLEVTEVCTAGATITIGFGAYGAVSAQTQGFMSNDIAAPQDPVGIRRAQKDKLLSFPGRYFEAGSSILTTTLAGTFTLGKFRIFMSYSVIR